MRIEKAGNGLYRITITRDEAIDAGRAALGILHTDEVDLFEEIGENFRIELFCGECDDELDETTSKCGNIDCPECPDFMDWDTEMKLTRVIEREYFEEQIDQYTVSQPGFKAVHHLMGQWWSMGTTFLNPQDVLLDTILCQIAIDKREK